MDEAVNVVQPLNAPQDNSKILAVAVVVLAIVGGAVTGYFASIKSTSVPTSSSIVTAGAAKAAGEEGVKDTKNFPDEAEGVLKPNDGKITKEGTHILVRGDITQNAYLTSSVVDLDKYVDRKIHIWGKTYGAQKAGWLLEVGKVKVIQ